MKRYIQSLKHAIAGGFLHQGDVLLFRGEGAIAKVIQAFTGSEYSHAAMVGWWAVDNDAEPMCLESREWVGIRSTTLASQVKRAPGRIDVYRIRDGWKRTATMGPSVAYMRDATGGDYGYANVLAASVRRLPVWRFLVKPDTNDKAVSKSPPFCSQLVDQALRKVDQDVAPNKASRLTTPGDLATSSTLVYQYTLGAV